MRVKFNDPLRHIESIDVDAIARPRPWRISAAIVPASGLTSRRGVSFPIPWLPRSPYRPGRNPGRSTIPWRSPGPMATSLRP